MRQIAKRWDDLAAADPVPQAEGRARPRVPRHADRSHQEPGPERVRGHRAPAALQAAGRWVEARARAPLHDRAGLQNPLWPLL